MPYPSNDYPTTLPSYEQRLYSKYDPPKIKRDLVFAILTLNLEPTEIHQILYVTPNHSRRGGLILYTKMIVTNICVLRFTISFLLGELGVTRASNRIAEI